MTSTSDPVEPLPKSQRWHELDSKQRRRAIIHTVVDLTLLWVVLFGVYYLIPFTGRTDRQALVRLGLSIAAFAIILVWQLSRITNAKFPALRAVQALGITIPLFLVAFASFYLSLSGASESHFSEPLNHTGALYLTITVFSTVGFGDITPKDDFTRISMSIQMLLDLVVIGAVVRLLSSAAKTGIERS